MSKSNKREVALRRLGALGCSLVATQVSFATSVSRHRCRLDEGGTERPKRTTVAWYEGAMRQTRSLKAS